MNKLTDILKKIDELHSEIEGHGKLDVNLAKRIEHKFRLDWNYFSNAMEGNSLTRIETKQLMMDNVTIDGKSFKDISEMRGHDDIVQEIFKVGKGEVRISEKRIKGMHKAIMHEDDPEKKEFVGQWKTSDNYLINYKKEKFYFLAHAEVPEAIHNLINKTNAEIDALSNSKKESKHPVLIAFEFHLEYVRIHPFYDGNGRTARLLTNLLLISFGFPPFLLSEKSRDSYNRILAEIQGYGGDKNDFHILLGNLLIESQELVLAAIAGKDISGDDDVDKEVLLFKQSLRNSAVDLQGKSDFLISQVYKSSIRPLFELFLEKHAQFDDLFAERKIENCIDNSFRESTGLSYFEQWVDNVELNERTHLEVLLGKKDYSDQFNEFRNVNNLRLRINFQGFNKNGVNVFNAYSEIGIVFNQYKYSIADENHHFDEKYQKFYSQSYTEQEAIEIVNEKVKIFLEKLRSRITE